jgi:hypothetical protein
VTLGGVPAHRRLRESAPHLTRTVVRLLAEWSPVYRTLPPEELWGDVARVVDGGIRDFAATLAGGGPPDEDRLAVVRAAAARRAEEGLPLEAVTGAYFTGARVCFEEVVRAARPEDLPAVVVLQRLLLEYLERVTGAVAAGYLDRVRSSAGERHGARQALLASLLRGRVDAAAADRAGLAVPPGYVVLALSLGPHPDERTPGVDAGVAARRKVRRVRGELDHRTRGTALTALGPDGGLVLLPCDARDGRPAADWAALRATVARLDQVAGGALLAAAVEAEPAGAGEAARLAADLLAVARAGGRAPGLYRLADLALEYQLTRPGPARDHVAGLLAPLDDRPELLATLAEFVACGLDRRRTAARLRIHPNTVLYRLRKAADLTGLDATRCADLPVLHAALACRPPGPAPADEFLSVARSTVADT